MKQKLIDANELMKLIPSEEMVSKLAVANAPTVEAIPISWINDYLWHIMATNKITSVEERGFKMVGIKDMLFVWEHWGEENGFDK